MSTVEPARSIEIAAIEDASLLAFYRDMNLPERRTFWACASGSALDGMDFMIYPLVIGTIIAIFAVAAYGVFFIAAFALPETRGRILHADG